MDIQLEKKKGIRPKHIPYILGGAILLGAFVWMIFGEHSSTLKVDKRVLSVVKVENELFKDYVSINGQLQPISIVQLTPDVGGKLKEKVVEEGAVVKKGDVIIRLSNSNLDLQILNTEADLAEKQNFLRNTQVTMEQDKLNNRNEKLQLDLEIVRKKRSYQQKKSLFQDDVIPKEEYIQAKEDYELAIQKHALIIERLKQDSIYRSLQIDRLEGDLANMEKNVELIRLRKDDLNVKALIDGELASLNVELGQNIGEGQKIGQINDLSDYKVVAFVVEHYIDRVSRGLKASLERQDKFFNLKLNKVFPEVLDGKFKVELTFEDERPEHMKSGQTYYLNLELGEPVDGIIIPKGTFYQSTGGTWIYVVDKDGKQAYRREIKIGRQNPKYYEVLEGLEAGEQVIVSSYDSFKDVDVLVLQ